MLPRIDVIIDKVRDYNPGTDEQLLQRAYLFSAFAHEGQTRHSGEPYLIHPLSVTDILTDLKADDICLVAGLLHDVVEDNWAVPIEDVKARFGEDVSSIVEGLTKIDTRMAHTSREEQSWDNLRKLVLAMVDDIRVILVKLADRLHNLRTLEFMPEEKRGPKARETLEVYAPIANRLGLGRMKIELEDLGFKHSHPEEYEKIDKAIRDKRSVSDGFLDELRDELQVLLKSQKIAGTVQGRIKHYYSIFNKLVRQGIDIEQVYDYLAFRVVVGDVKECYEVLGGIHGLWKPIPGRFKDFIAIPKENHYRSLHTSVVGPKGHAFEIQIRTREMHREAENGVAAHWRYKEGRLREEDESATMEWLRQLLDWSQDAGTSTEFVQNLKLDLYPEEVYVFTPQGEVKSFPRGSTPLDFAYAIHSDVGRHCAGAKINGKLVPLRTALHSGDRVEIMTSSNANPSRDWLTLAITGRAQRKIRAWLNAQEKKRAVELGKSALDREMKRLRVTYRIAEESGTLEEALRRVSLPDLDSLYSEIGYGKVSARIFAKKLVPPSPAAERETHPKPEVEATRGPPIIVRGASDLLTSLAKCCKPIVGDDVVGFISRGKGLVVHRRDCRNIARRDIDPHRIMEVEWGSSGQVQATQEARIVVHTEGRDGIVPDLTRTISDARSDVRSIQANLHRGEGVIRLIVAIRDRSHLQSVLTQIRRIPGVLEASRSR